MKIQGSLGGSNGEKMNSDDDKYCIALAKELYNLPSPVTVGLYTSWGRRKDILLDKIEYHLNRESNKKKDKSSAHRKTIGKGKNLVILLFRMIFYNSFITKKHKERNNIYFIFIRFSAWEFAGCDKLWAGLVTTLCDQIKDKFGRIPISIYRLVDSSIDSDSSDETKETLHEKEWIRKKVWPSFKWALIFILGIVVATILFFSVGNDSNNVVEAAEGIGVTLAGISAIPLLGELFRMLKNIIFTQKDKLLKKMNRTDMSSQLGFMSDVKKEVNIITRYIQLMEVFQKQKIRVVLEITNLGKCTPDKVVGVLNAMNILLSDQNAPFISILAVDPSIIVDYVESSQQLKGMANNGYQFLNRIITLPFSIPKIYRKPERPAEESHREGSAEASSENEDIDTSVSGMTQNEETPLLTYSQHDSKNKCSSCIQFSNGHIEEKQFKDYLEFLNGDRMKRYRSENVIQNQRVKSSLCTTIRFMRMKVPKPKIDVQKVVKWVILVTQWPCRLSWVLQCVEDEQQRLDKDDPLIYDKVDLHKVFVDSLEELHANKELIKQLLDLDGDPEIFQKLLKDGFKVKDIELLLPSTVNLDHSLKRKMELLRGINHLGSNREIDRICVCDLVKMSPGEVCDEMRKLGFTDQNLQMYQERIKTLKLNGRKLYDDFISNTKKTLAMDPDDWTVFSVHFLGVLPPPVLAHPLVSACNTQDKFRVQSTKNLLQASTYYNSAEDRV